VVDRKLICKYALVTREGKEGAMWYVIQVFVGDSLVDWSLRPAEATWRYVQHLLAVNPCDDARAMVRPR
jgi:hypothetical protein